VKRSDSLAGSNSAHEGGVAEIERLLDHRSVTKLRTERAGSLRTNTFARYLAFQAPAWIIGALVAWALDRWSDIPRWMLLLALALYLAKDLFLYRFVKLAYEHTPHDPVDTLQGDRGVVVVDLKPIGWVRVGSERWRAELVRDVSEVAAGATVRIVGMHGVTLIVEPDTEQAS